MLFILTIEKKQAEKLRSCLKKWRLENGLREYPWRSESDPFRILVTEVLLRRTKAEAVNQIWKSFFTKYNNFHDIRAAKREVLSKDIASLGLARIRTESLRKISDTILNNGIPENEEELVRIPGIGIYSARMFLLLTKEERHLIYDSNFRRVYSRFFGVEININLRSDKNINEISELVIPKTNIKEFILTILDFASLTCKPINPNCNNCCCNKSCSFHLNKIQQQD